MILAYPEGPLETALWIDLYDPAPEEIAAVEAATGFVIPSRAALSEIETSSRLKAVDHTLYLSCPVLTHSATPEPEITPMGFVVCQRVLVTVRFARLHAVEAAAASFAASGATTGLAAFVHVVEAMVDRSADLLEAAGAELDSLSRQVFRNAGREGRKLARANIRLRLILGQVGRLGDRLGKIRGNLLGLARIAPFAAEVAHDWLGGDLQTRLSAARTDLLSLADYETHLEGKNQFLLDAVLGFINTEQNDLFKILTIVSVVGVPPTLVASIYGMNFVNMPELHWTLGYPYALGLIILTTVLPMLWFKWKGWW